ncbi:MAG TPA: adenylate/guanylate cyclase domain-containing protein [Candidatus Acidoferrales bacterium]|nr:adenylate/guanylate cyclase domain-containing protein [Candidatus Acidoferrales bacterium]
MRLQAHGAEPGAERRVVSVLFADLVGFTPFAEERDAEEVRETLTRYFDLASDVIGQYGGTVEKFIGDAVMAVWGAPVAREDDAERAVRAALDLVDAVRTLGPSIQARAGVLTGEAAVTIGATNQGMVAGDIVNTASRLQSAAAPGTVLVGEATERAASGAIVFEVAGDHALKGKTVPVPAWRALRVVAQRGGRNRSETLEAPFVGRDEELRQLKELFQTTNRERRPRLVSVIGPAGIGKTRLAWEFLKYLDGLLDRVWWHAGRSPAYGDGITFWALGEMVRGRAGLAEADDEATTRARIAETVRAHVPDTAEPEWIESALLALLGVDVQIGPDQLFAAWRTFFEGLAASSPVVMVFEDLHHADQGLLDFIDHLMEWSRGVPITVITLARPELLDRRPDWGAGKRSFASIYLEPLPPLEMGRLLAGLVPGLPQKAVASIVARADGVPLYAVETVRMLLAQGRLVLEGEAYRPIGTLDDVAVPETLAALIAARLDVLDPLDRALVEDAAVLGQSFSIQGLAAISGQTEDGLEARLRGLARRELFVLDVDPRSPERGHYAFVQALIREVAYNTLSRKDRKVRHLAAARYFENLGTDELAAGLAGHYLAAQRLASDPVEAEALAAQARVALKGAAERAAALGSHEQAVAFLEQALETTTDPADRAELHERALTAAGEGLIPEVIMRHAEEAVVERRRAGDRPAIARAVAKHARAISGTLGDPERALAYLLDAWAEFSDLEQTPAGVELMSTLAAANRGRNDAEGSMAWVDRFMPIAERLGLLEATTSGMVGRGTSLIVLGQPRQGIVLLRGAHELAASNDMRAIERNARVLMTFFEQWGEPAVGLALAREGLEIGRRVGSRSYGFQMVGNGSICALRVGEWDWTAALLEDWLAIEGTSSQRAELYVDRAILRSMRGDDPTADREEATRLRREGGITDPQWESYELWAEAWAAFAAGDGGEVRRLGERAIELTSYFAPLVYPLLIRTALWAGDRSAAAAALSSLETSGYFGPALTADRVVARAGIDALEGRGPDALAGYRDALRAYHQLALAFDEAAAAVDMAVLLPSSERDAPDVEVAMGAARETLERLDARPFLDRLGVGGSVAT